MKHPCAATPVAAFLLLLTSLFSAPAALASARIGLEPLQLVLPGNALAASVNISNGGTKPVTFQAELLAWSQVNGEDVLVPSKDLIVTPLVFSVPVDGRQTVRVGRLKRVAPGPVEKTYRLALTEIPPETEARPDVVTTALRVALPVFLVPANPTPPTFTWFAAPAGQGLALAISNVGNTTVRIRGLNLLRGADVVTQRPVQFSVLPGITRTITLTNLPPGATDGELRVETELNTRRKVVQSLVLGPLPAAAPKPLAPTSFTPVAGSAPAPATRP